MSLGVSSSEGHQETFFLSNPEDDASLSDAYPSRLELRHAKTSIHDRKPLRSSPLAGPAVLSISNDSEAPTPASHARLRRATSSPMRPEPRASIIRLSLIHDRPYSSYDLPVRLTPSPSRPESSIQVQPTPRTPPRTPSPLSIRSTYPSIKSPTPNRASKVLDDVGNRPARESAHDPVKPLQPARLRKTPTESELRSDAPSQDTYGIYPSFLPAPAPTKAKSDFDKAGARDDSWYTANTYALTPKFTRLGLSAPNVVMPVSAREHRRRTPRNSAPVPTSPLNREHPIPLSPTPPLASLASGSRRASAQAQAHAPLPESLPSNNRARRSLSPLTHLGSSSDHQSDSPSMSKCTTPTTPESLIYTHTIVFPAPPPQFPASSSESRLPSSTSHRPNLAGTSGCGLILPNPDERSLHAPCLGHDRNLGESEETVQENHANTHVQYKRPVTPAIISIPVLRIRKSLSRVTIKRKLQPSPAGVEAQPQVKLSRASPHLKNGKYSTDVKVEVADGEDDIEPIHPQLLYRGSWQPTSDSNSMNSSLDANGKRLSMSDDGHLNPALVKRKPSTVRRLWRTLTGGGGRGRGSRVA